MTDIVAIVAAAATSRGIGVDGNLPWKLPGDMLHFKQVTMETFTPETKNAVIMGRKTWDSIPPKFRPLEGRTNVILTRQSKSDLNLTTTEQQQQDIIVASSLEDAIQQLQERNNNNNNPSLGKIFIIGGAQVYQQTIQSGLVNKVIYTQVYHNNDNIHQNTKFDTFFPELDKANWECRPYTSLSSSTTTTTDPSSSLEEEEAPIQTDPKTGLCYKFLEYNKIQEGTHINPQEMQYLKMCQDIIQNGIKRDDRTGTGTLSKFGTQMRFSLRDGTLPLLTTKRVFWRGVAEELIWFISGTTNANELAAKNIHIWDGNGSREFLDSRGLSHREAGDLGPVYGFQWRHFGAKYEDMHADYTGQGVDQLAECIHKIKHNPTDRRILLSAWNPADMDQMALPPCHMFCQFYVDTEKGELSCQMYQRSADMGLGVPFNIASYALLTHMIAQVCGLKPGDFVHTIGDAHVYLNHVDALKEQLERSPREFPKIKINPEKKNIDDFIYEDFEVIGYKPHKTIKMKMAV